MLWVLLCLATDMKAATIPTPSVMANQIHIACPFSHSLNDQLEFKHPLAAERPANAVREGAEVGAREVALIVARVEMVRDVEHLQAHRGVVMKQTQPLTHLQIERHERGIATGLVPR